MSGLAGDDQAPRRGWRGRPMRVAAGVAGIGFVLALWLGGAQPVAVGLIPAPWDKLAHALAFGSLAVLVEIALQPPLISFFLLPLAVSAADEFHQAFLPGRMADVDDWIAGAVGVAVVWWLLRRTPVASLVAWLRNP